MSETLIEKILNHPDKDDIISRLTSGIKSKEVFDWLKSKYPNTKPLQLTLGTIENFDKNVLNIYNRLKQDVEKDVNIIKQSMAKDPKKSMDELSQEMELTIKSNPTYNQKIMELVSADNKVDIKRMIGTTLLTLEERSSQFFDIMQSDPKIVGKLEENWGKLLDRTAKFIELYSKYVDEKPDQVIQHNVSVELIDKQSQVLQEAIKEVLSEMDLSMSLIFIQKMNDKLKKLKFQSQVPANNNELTVSETLKINDEINKRLLQ